MTCRRAALPRGVSQSHRQPHERRTPGEGERGWRGATPGMEQITQVVAVYAEWQFLPFMLCSAREAERNPQKPCRRDGGQAAVTRRRPLPQAAARQPLAD